MNWFKNRAKKAEKLRLDKRFPILKGHPKARGHAREAAKASAKLPETRKRHLKEFQIYRWNPEQPNRKPFLQSFFVDLATCARW